MRFAVLVLLGGLVGAPAAWAQTGIFEGGGAGLGAAVTYRGVTVSDGVGGGYIAGSVSPPAADWLSIFGGVNALADIGTLGQAGASFRLGPANWIAKPVLRGGAAFGDVDALVTGGVGIYIGRRGGGLFTADWSASEGVTYAIVHFGAYYTFGGRDAGNRTP